MENDIFLVILTTREALDDNTAQTSEKCIRDCTGQIDRIFIKIVGYMFEFFS